ncbi:MAG: hypothetical protein J0M16_02650 [Gammaproteobacteria bacterium]|nr:hypothetical protein [Gammaproteobacteria bacterium]
MEDFLANNFPQSVGLKTDYYDKAMGLATQLEEVGIKAEYAGHSLAGGMASAMSAVTGRPATTFNAAGLHPETARRFAEENPGTQVFDVGQRVASYQVAGEFLGDGVQHNIDRLDALHRRELAGVLKEMNDWIDHTPDGRALMQRGLAKLFPGKIQQQAAVSQFVRTLADGDVDRMLKELPLAAGTTAACYVLAGEVTLADGRVARATELVVLDREGDGAVLGARGNATVFVMNGEPIREPIAGYGPFVMNTPEEIRQALADLRSGRLATLPAELA